MTSILKTDEIQSQNGGAVVKMQTLKHPSASGNNLELASDGSTTIANGTLSAGTIGSGVVFPAGYVLRSFYDEVIDSSTQITTTGGIYSNLELSISSPSTSNYLEISYCIPDVYNAASANRRLRIGVVYSTDNWSTNSQFGSNTYVQSWTGQATTNTGVLQNHCGTIRAQHPTSSDYKVRLYLKSIVGEMYLFHSGDCVGTLTGYEIKG